MPDDRPSELLGQLPRTRPHRRSTKRAARPEKSVETKSVASPPTKRPAAGKTGAAKPKARSKPLPQPAQPRGVPTARRRRPPAPAGKSAEQPPRAPALGTALGAAAELAEIGLALSTRALRRAIDRLPRP